MTTTVTPQRRILVTGATRGLGRAMVEGFAQAGHHVAGCGRAVDGVAALKAAYPAPHRFDVVDTASDIAVAEWATQLLATFGTPDLLICNAALMNAPAPLWRVPADEFDRLIDVNVKGVANTLRHFVPAMITAGRGVIVTLSSGWGKTSSPNVAPYCASKFAIEGLTAALAQELPTGLAAVAVSPGVIATEMLQLAMGAGANQHQSAEDWKAKAVPFFLGLDTRNNGSSLRIP